MKFRTIFRVDRYRNGKFFKFNLFRFLWADRKKVIKLALQPRIFRYEVEPHRGWNVTILGFRITYEQSWAGRFV
jgi:hypothetical protein